MDEVSVVWTGSGLFYWNGRRGLFWNKKDGSSTEISKELQAAEEGDKEAVWTGRSVLILNDDKAYEYYP